MTLRVNVNAIDMPGKSTLDALVQCTNRAAGDRNGAATTSCGRRSSGGGAAALSLHVRSGNAGNEGAH